MSQLQTEHQVEDRFVRVRIRVRTLDIVPLRESSPQKRSVMAHFLKGSHSFTCTPTRSSVIGMSHTCLCLLCLCVLRSILSSGFQFYLVICCSANTFGLRNTCKSDHFTEVTWYKMNQSQNEGTCYLENHIKVHDRCRYLNCWPVHYHGINFHYS